MTCDVKSPLLDRISESDDLPSLPTVAIEVLRLTRDPNAGLDEITDVIQNDPALSAKMLKVVNSSLFGLSRPVSSLNQAISLLGLRTVKVMALSFSLVDVTNRDRVGGFDYERFWRQSVTSGVAARSLSAAAGAFCSDEAFVASLLADIGSCLAYRSAPDLYGPVLDAAAESDEPLQEVEQRMLGVDHAEIGRRLLADWNLPEQLCAVVGSHHGRGLPEVGERPEPAHFAYAAGLISDVFCRQIASTRLTEVREEVERILRLERRRVEEVFETLDAHVHETASLLSVQVGETSDYDRIRADAAAALTQLSIEAEVDRLQASEREATARGEVDRLAEEREEILKTAATDKLTGLNNRAALDAQIEKDIERSRAEAMPIGLILLDIDRFKEFNDEFGHQAGDAVLEMVGKTLREIADKVGFAARYGGEEFALILTSEAARVATKIADLVRRSIAATTVEHQGRTLSVTASLGVAVVKTPDESLIGERLIELADKRLYIAKRTGRDRVVAED